MYSEIIVILFQIICTFHPSSSSIPIKSAYWPSYQSSSFPSNSIKFSYFTHIYYAFVQIDPASFNLTITQDDSTDIPVFISNSHNHGVKTLLTIGGGASNLTTFTNIVTNKTRRGVFIENSIAVARSYGFDGLDLDWEFPKNSLEMQSLGQLFQEWRDAINKEREESGLRTLLLSAAVYYDSIVPLDGVIRAYPTEVMGKTLDMINAMCYDYYGSWNVSETNAPAALYSSNQTAISTSHGIESWIKLGFPPNKLVMGIPLYGRTWQLKNASVHGIAAPADAVGPGQDGTMAYSQVLQFNQEHNATTVHDEVIISAYSFAANVWIGYDDVNTVKTKVEFAKAREIGGYFFWALGDDDENWTLSYTAWSSWQP